MAKPEVRRRYAPATVVKAVAADLGLPHDDQMQDPDIELANSGRLDDFVEYFLSTEPDSDERLFVGELLIGSLDDLLNLKCSDRYVDAVRELLLENYSLFRGAIYYWARADVNEPDEEFAVTMIMRDIIRDAE